MKALSERWDELLACAEQRLTHYLEATTGLSHESKGIRRSELFFFYVAAARLHPGRILESGRARAQSTVALARLFPELSIISLESDRESPDIAIATKRLRDYPNVDSRFGNSLLLLPMMVQPGDVILIDGPKDFRALRLAFRLLRDGRPLAVFVHDLWPRSPARRFVDRHVGSALLSDEPRWVERYAMLDSSKPRPPISSNVRRAYGATLGFFESGLENYALRLWQCTAAQRAERLRETARKLLHRDRPLSRPHDFDPLLEERRPR